MPYAKCPTCGQISHYAVKNLEQWHKKHNPDFKETTVLPCFGCWKELKEGDIVCVLSKPNEKSLAEAGGVGTITAIHNNVKTPSYEVKSVLPNGKIKWTGVFKRNQIRYEIALNKK